MGKRHLVGKYVFWEISFTTLDSLIFPKKFGLTFLCFTTCDKCLGMHVGPICYEIFLIWPDVLKLYSRYLSHGIIHSFSLKKLLSSTKLSLIPAGFFLSHLKWTQCFRSRIFVFFFVLDITTTVTWEAILRGRRNSNRRTSRVGNKPITIDNAQCS